MQEWLTANGFTYSDGSWTRGSLKLIQRECLWYLDLGLQAFLIRSPDHLGVWIEALERSRPNFKITEYANQVFWVESLNHTPNRGMMVRLYNGFWYVGLDRFNLKENAIHTAIEAVLC